MPNIDETKTGAGAVASCGSYAKPLTETTIREAAVFLYAMRQSIIERMLIQKGAGNRRAAAARARQAVRINKVIRQLEAALA